MTGSPGAVGAGYDVLIFSGAGRLDSIALNPPFQSGLLRSIIFYDAGVVSSGGPFPSSGTKIIGYTPDLVALVSGFSPVSGNTGAVGLLDILAGAPRQISTPFQSGLCVALKSGQCGFTVGWTPEVPNQ